MPSSAENIARRAALRAQHGPAMEAVSAASAPLGDDARRELEHLLADAPRRPLQAQRAG